MTNELSSGTVTRVASVTSETPLSSVTPPPSVQTVAQASVQAVAQECLSNQSQVSSSSSQSSKIDPNERDFKGFSASFPKPADRKKLQQVYLNAIQSNPKDAQAYLNLGNILEAGEFVEISCGDWNREFCFINAIELDPGNRLAYISLGDTLKAGQAIQLLNGALMTKKELYTKGESLRKQ